MSSAMCYVSSPSVVVGWSGRMWVSNQHPSKAHKLAHTWIGRLTPRLGRSNGSNGWQWSCLSRRNLLVKVVRQKRSKRSTSSPIIALNGRLLNGAEGGTTRELFGLHLPCLPKIEPPGLISILCPRCTLVGDKPLLVRNLTCETIWRLILAQ